jgi:hypothetical protein
MLGNKGVNLAVSSVEKIVEAATDGQAKLAGREEVLGKGVGILKGNDGAGKAVPSGTNTNWTDLSRSAGSLWRARNLQCASRCTQ